jgi:hypothetical protein
MQPIRQHYALLYQVCDRVGSLGCERSRHLGAKYQDTRMRLGHSPEQPGTL